ncbi:hypothetical protein MAC_06132 [Metarhizium acridum CQMa 102]|uniref:Uncharacterized protein n=1 Tax=Metarhizium acridum (strain CQMa 102) TaxID=655827 RepID=E9E8D4_METAQ|nr:uncharacterized protein MAC_06132 [Metarhizium acridum CQMa 102]EFY87765.1 hypothetical protein MAC_06132 [Metarhizium acridum CQMa 102]
MSLKRKFLHFNDENELSDNEIKLFNDENELKGDDDIPEDHSMSRRTLTMIRLTPDDARRWFEDPLTTFGVLSEDEIACLDRIRDSNNFYATDTEAVGQLLVQAAVVDSNQRVVFSGHIHHDCATAEELWQLATDVNGGRLTSVESIGLPRASGSPSTQPPQGYSVAWLSEQWRLLKKKAPDLQIAE